MPNRVELARPFAVVEENGTGGIVTCESEAEARENAAYWDKHCADDAPHIVVRLTAERVEEPIPEAKSGWWYSMGRDGFTTIVTQQRGDDRQWVAAWNGTIFGEVVPPCDHAHVAALLRREGVET